MKSKVNDWNELKGILGKDLFWVSKKSKATTRGKVVAIEINDKEEVFLNVSFLNGASVLQFSLDALNDTLFTELKPKEPKRGRR